VETYLVKLATLFILPPGVNLLGAATGALLARRWRRMGLGLVAISLLALYLLSAPGVAYWLVRGLERHAPLDLEDDRIEPPAAIVVLGGGVYPRAPEWGGDTVSAATLARLRYGARLERATGLPLLVTGGHVLRRGPSEAELMRRVLEQEFGVAVTWTEERSRNTAENASLSAPILHAAGIRTVVLVTHAWHMPRALAAFEREGLEVVPAPTGFLGPALDVEGLFRWLPQVGALRASAYALHERAGRAWYRLRYGVL